jgi:hypothetical protein
MGQSIFFVLVVAFAVVSAVWHFSRARTILERWAARDGYVLVSAERCWFWRGPFWLRSDKEQVVFRVVVRDRENRTLSGYVRCGGWILGMLSDDVAVEWD